MTGELFHDHGKVGFSIAVALASMDKAKDVILHKYY